MNKLFLFFLAFGLSYLVNSQGKTYGLQTDLHYYNDDLNKKDAYMMRVAGHKDTRIIELDDYGHNMTYPAFPLLLNEVKRLRNLLK